jgi:hypothetical protein
MQIENAFSTMHSVYSRGVVKVNFAISNKTIQIQMQIIMGPEMRDESHVKNDRDMHMTEICQQLV